MWSSVCVFWKILASQQKNFHHNSKNTDFLRKKHESPKFSGKLGGCVFSPNPTGRSRHPIPSTWTLLRSNPLAPYLLGVLEREVPRGGTLNPESKLDVWSTVKVGGCWGGCVGIINYWKVAMLRDISSVDIIKVQHIHLNKHNWNMKHEWRCTYIFPICGTSQLSIYTYIIYIHGTTNIYFYIQFLLYSINPSFLIPSRLILRPKKSRMLGPIWKSSRRLRTVMSTESGSLGSLLLMVRKSQRTTGWMYKTM